MTYGVNFQKLEACGCKEPKKEDHLEFRKRAKEVEKT